MLLGDNAIGDNYYVEIDTIKEHNGYVYWWVLTNRLKPNEFGDMSVKGYFQGDCGTNRYKSLSFIFYKQPMGEDEVERVKPPNDEWEYPTPDSTGHALLSWACDQFR